MRKWACEDSKNQRILVSGKKTACFGDTGKLLVIGHASYQRRIHISFLTGPQTKSRLWLQGSIDSGDRSINTLPILGSKIRFGMANTWPPSAPIRPSLHNWPCMLNKCNVVRKFECCPLLWMPDGWMHGSMGNCILTTTSTWYLGSV